MTILAVKLWKFKMNFEFQQVAFKQDISINNNNKKKTCHRPYDLEKCV